MKKIIKIGCFLIETIHLFFMNIMFIFNSRISLVLINYKLENEIEKLKLLNAKIVKDNLCLMQQLDLSDRKCKYYFKLIKGDVLL